MENCLTAESLLLPPIMEFNSTQLSYKETGQFSKIVVDYIDASPQLKPFYNHPVSIEGIKAAIKSRMQFNTDRTLLVSELKKQYENVSTTEAVEKNIEKLLADNTFTVCTAHQPAIFTGTLYFIYKILHAIKLSQQLGNELPQYQFVPVFYMGCEDADLDELGSIWLNGEKLVWDTKQTGAVGRMNTKGLEKLIYRIEGELSVQPYGKELMQLLKDCYLTSPDIQTATFKLVNALFAAYGLIVLIPDNGNLKKTMVSIFEDDLLNQKPSTIVEKTINDLSQHYKVQANPREINLFYLKDNLRARIIQGGTRYKIQGTSIEFSKDELQQALKEHPEHFSPNVILRGLFQETILPNIAFIGGGGELAYWLELKDLFEHYNVPYPVQVLRNSFLLVEKRWKEKLLRNGFDVKDCFKTADSLLNKVVTSQSEQQLNLSGEIEHANNHYLHLKNVAAKVDVTLSTHVEALQVKALKPLRELEKKMLRAEKRKFEEQKRSIQLIKSALFPQDSLQERIDTFLPYYAKWGKSFLDVLLNHSLTLDQQFVVLEEA